MTKLTFTNKVEYLAFKAQWKEEYRVLSDMQRTTKNEIKIINHDYSKSGSSLDLIVLRREQDKMLGNRYLAEQKIKLYHTAKRLAQQQYLAGKKQAENQEKLKNFHSLI